MLLRVLLVLHLALALCAAAGPVQAETTVVTEAMSINSSAERFPADQAAAKVALPDDWSRSRPRYDGSAWYRVSFDPPAGLTQDDLQALYIERACTNLEVFLNGHRIFSGGSMKEPLPRHCNRPQIITLPAALLKAQNNLIDLHVQGSALQRVASRQRAGGLSSLEIGPEAALAREHRFSLFWNQGAVEIMAMTLLVIGLFMLGLYRMNRSEAYLLYFGALLLGWAALSARIWWTFPPFDTATAEFIACTALPPVVGFAVQFLLSYARLRSRIIEGGLWIQCLLLPLSLVIAGPMQTFLMASAWFVLLGIELFAAMTLYLVVTWKSRSNDFWPMLFILGGVGLALLFEMATQQQPEGPPITLVLHFAIPLLLVAIAARLLQLFARALQAAEAGRSSLEGRVKDITAEIERNFAQLSSLRVEQVTEKERKRIAADLHDDLGAKLLTIVHTSESERISTLAREALEEMRLSVRGLTGKPVRLADALADWRAEVVMRLGQANVEADWHGPAEDIEHLLPARAYVQTTRIFREAVSNIIKHSGASLCQVRSHVGEREFGVTIQDNGKGIPMELDGKLDRGHGMSSMKHRAKQLAGQCLVESGPGYGTVIRLTLPL
jgi:signal transduction histidine kinase